MLPAESSPAQGQPLQLKNSQPYGSTYQVSIAIPANLRRKRESSLQKPATAALDEWTFNINAPVQIIAASVRQQQLHPLYHGNSTLDEPVERLSKKTPHRSSQGNASNVYEGYARSTEQFIQDASGTYVPVSLGKVLPRTSQPYPSASASLYSGITQARARQAWAKVEEMEESHIRRQLNMCPVNTNEHAAPPSQETIFTPLQRAEHNFIQKYNILDQVANDTTKKNLEIPSQEAILPTNKLVEGFYERGNIQLLDTLRREWESTRLEYAGLCSRVDSSTVYFYE